MCGHLLLLLLGRVQVDWEVDELGVALDEPLEPLFLEELEAVLLEGEHDLGAAAELLACRREAREGSGQARVGAGGRVGAGEGRGVVVPGRGGTLASAC